MKSSPRVRDESGARRSEVAALLAAANAVLENRAFVDAARAILGACRSMLGAEAGVVEVRRPNGRGFEVAHLDPGSPQLGSSSGQSAPLRRLRARASRAGGTVFDNDLSKSAARPPPGRRAPPRNALFAPIVIAGEVAGLVGLIDKPGGFSAPDARLCEVFAEMAAVAMLGSNTVDGLEVDRNALEREVRLGAAQLRSAEAKFKTLVENLPDIVARFDPQLRYLYVSPAVQAVSGRPAQEYPGRTIQAMGVAPALAESWNAALREVFATGRPERLELAIPTPDGTRRFDCRIVPETDAGGATPSVLSVARDVTEMQESTLRMQALSRRLVEVQEGERRHIARELHDEAGQALASLRFGLRLLEREIDEGASVTGRVAELVERTDAVIDGLHRLAADLRPPSLDHLGLEAALRQYSRSAESKFGLTVRFKARGFTSDRLPAAVETGLYRVVQEAMTNVVRHARATRVDVLVERRGDRVVLVVEDDGVGFEPDRVRRGEHFGLLGLRERAESLGGTLTLESAPGAGTTIVVEVPGVDPPADR